MSTDLQSLAILPGLLTLGVALGAVWGRFSENSNGRLLLRRGLAARAPGDLRLGARLSKGTGVAMTAKFYVVGSFFVRSRNL